MNPTRQRGAGISCRAWGCSFVAVSAQVCVQNVVEKLYREIVLII
jgi:hypothetical protein